MMGTQQWDAGHYDQHLGFVSEFGKDVVEWLHPQAGERILDLGCGTGDLVMELRKRGIGSVIGMDASVEMIERAKQKAIVEGYEDMMFRVGDGQSFQLDSPVDAVFSNAALHWMKEAEGVIQSIAQALRPGGRFVAEFGGQNNCKEIIQAIGSALWQLYGIRVEDRIPWYFPTIGEYTTLLEKHGFRVSRAIHFARPTPFHGGEQGLSIWLEAFGEALLQGLTAAERNQAVSRAEEIARSTLFNGHSWVGDYWRIRFEAWRLV